jgi:hypothetical protein
MTHAGEFILTYVSRGSRHNDPTWRVERWSGSGADRQLVDVQSMSHTAVLKMSPLWEERGFKVTIPAYELRF